MKYITLITLFFISTCCFAMDQKLIDGANAYEAAVRHLEKIENNLTAQGYFGLWASDDMRNFNPDQIDETDERWHGLSVQYNEAKKTVKKYEPIKNKYDKQKAREEEIKDTILGVIIILSILLSILSILAFIFGLIIYQHKKYKRLLKEGKITQEEFNYIMKPHESKSIFNNDLGVNPSTGLPLIGNGVCDAGGNLRGSSPSSSSFDYSQDYRNRHRWD